MFVFILQVNSLPKAIKTQLVQQQQQKHTAQLHIAVMPSAWKDSVKDNFWKR